MSDKKLVREYMQWLDAEAIRLQDRAVKLDDEARDCRIRANEYLAAASRAEGVLRSK